MAEIKHQYFDFGVDPRVTNVGLANRAIGDVDSGDFRLLQHSSPWPWIFATIISLAMWASLGWLVWVSVR
jgi:hypothetical protein